MVARVRRRRRGRRRPPSANPPTRASRQEREAEADGVKPTGPPRARQRVGEIQRGDRLAARLHLDERPAPGARGRRCARRHHLGAHRQGVGERTDQALQVGTRAVRLPLATRTTMSCCPDSSNGAHPRGQAPGRQGHAGGGRWARARDERSASRVMPRRRHRRRSARPPARASARWSGGAPASRSRNQASASGEAGPRIARCASSRVEASGGRSGAPARLAATSSSSSTSTLRALQASIAAWWPSRISRARR